MNLRTLVTLLLLTFLSACHPPRPKVPPFGSGGPPQIDPPAAVPGKGLRAKVRPELLKELSDKLGGEVRAQFPAFEGDSFVVTLPVSAVPSVTSEEVFDTLILPITRAMGFERGADAIRMPASGGVRMQTADFPVLAQAVADEYSANPEGLRPKTQEMLDVMTGKAQPDREIDAAFQMGEGMSFAQFVHGIELLEIQYPFQQVHGTVPIEHTTLRATRADGLSIRSVRGVLYNSYEVTNRLRIDASEPAVQQAIHALSKVEGVSTVLSRWPEDDPQTVLLPYGSTPRGEVTMRYAHRMTLEAVWRGMEARFILWLDAENGHLLKLEPLLRDAVNASGEKWDRDPAIGTQVRSFRVDNAAGGEYVLALAGVMNRVDYLGDGNAANDLSISDSLNGSGPSFANFNQAAINDETQALCSSGSNDEYQQVNFFSQIYSDRQRTLGLGVFTPFPASAWNPRVESATAGCNAYASMNFGACPGYYDAACPNASDGTTDLSNFLNTAHDNTFVTHELAHNSTQRFTNDRPTDWCSVLPCPMPVGWGTLHDLCDAWSAHIHSTNCWSGWFAKNSGGVNNSLNCLNHDENGWAPRLHQVTTPFNPGAPGDHFPEHRAIASGVYADMQIASAALWEVRLGMRSKCRPSGMPQYGVRFARALKETGFFGTNPGSSDTGIYRYLEDLASEMTEQWATSGLPGGPAAFAHNGPHTTNKVTGGFARTGVFLIPYQCLDGDATTGDPSQCPVASGGENGADAVIDIDDNDVADDLLIHGVSHPEFDFLELGGPAPTFHVWTGPRYRLDGTGGSSTLTSPSPCNVEFQVDVSTDPAFAPAATVTSAWIPVDTDPATAASPECYSTWTPSGAQWTTLQAGGALTRLYYRARTRDTLGGNLRLSTEPGNGLWTVAAPYAVITSDGQSDY